jgi:hypothetical protein
VQERAVGVLAVADYAIAVGDEGDLDAFAL